MSGMGCGGTTSRGYLCLNQAKDGPFCPSHDPRLQCGAPTKKKGRCKRRGELGSHLCTVHRDGY